MRHTIINNVRFGFTCNTPEGGIIKYEREDKIMVKTLAMEEIRRKAPSVFADHASSKTSSKYVFIPTTKIMEDLRGEGWEPVQARESRVRDEENAGFQKHVVRFRHPDLQGLGNAVAKVGDVVPEIVLTNSHDRLSSFQMHAGLFRLVCSNGMTVADSTFARVRITHTGYAEQDVRNASETFFKGFPHIMASVEDMRAITLAPEEQALMATTAASLRWEPGTDRRMPFDPVNLLWVRRTADDDATLWHTFNRIQENLTKGGIRYRAANNQRRRTREIRGIGEDIRVNKALWAMAEGMVMLKRGATPDAMMAKVSGETSND
jgi:hypothetical protein